jgi:hypothetical protein
MVARELEMLRSSTIKIEDSMEDHKSKTNQLERTLKHKEWELEDTLNMKNLKIQELENTNRLLEKSSIGQDKANSEK